MDYPLPSDRFSAPPGFLSSFKCFVFYFSVLRLEDFPPVVYKVPPAPKPPRTMPPYNGFGSEEDSLCSCQGLLPKPPQKDFHKFMENDRSGQSDYTLTCLFLCGSPQLCFVYAPPPCPPFPRRCDVISVLNLRAKMVTTDPVDRDRVFIIYFYLCDDSICVFEQPQKNSGKI